MKVTLTNTTKLVEINGVPARVWEGETDTGIPVHAFITRIAVHKEEDSTQFEKELQEQAVPSAAVQVYPLQLII